MVRWNVRPRQLVAHLLIKDKCFYLRFIVFNYGF
jgi:hypothetical protein